MTAFEQFFNGHLFVINLQKRRDRRVHFEAEMEQIGVTTVERFDAIDAGPSQGNHGCSASHRAVMDLIVTRGLETAFVMEDDCTVREQFRNSFHETFAMIAPQIPADFDMIYLSGHYGEMPRARISRNIILMGEMKTTTSYGVTRKSARELRDIIPVGTGDSIDNLYASYNRTARCYISQPRLFVQYGNFSDLQQREMDNSGCMQDGAHEKMV